MGRLFPRFALVVGLAYGGLGGCSPASQDESVFGADHLTGSDGSDGEVVLLRETGESDVASLIDRHTTRKQQRHLSVRSPVAVGTPALNRQIAGGEHHSCALRSNAAVACWGANHTGQIGDGTTEKRAVPTTVVGLTDATSIVAGANSTCALRVGRTVACWGNNDLGQLGNGSTLTSSLPTNVEGLTNVEEVASGSYHTCARRADGSVACWGTNHTGQIGDGSFVDRFVPTPVLHLTDVVELAAGRGHTCARRVGGTVACWGHNFYGQVGDALAPNIHIEPFDVPGLDDVVAISAGHYHTCARRSSGQVSCWGQNLMGQLGDGSVVNRAEPIAIASMNDVVQVTAGGYHTCARRSSGELWCWGYNEFGQLDDASFNSRTMPAPVMGLTEAVDVLAGRFGHTCARRASGAVACWGSNMAGEIGDGTTLDRPTPTNVVGLP